MRRECRPPSLAPRDRGRDCMVPDIVTLGVLPDWRFPCVLLAAAPHHATLGSPSTAGLIESGRYAGNGPWALACEEVVLALGHPFRVGSWDADSAGRTPKE